MTNAVIFDMDGVIFDTERIWIECWSPVGQAHGIRDIEKVLKAQLEAREQVSLAEALDPLVRAPSRS